MWYVLRTHSAQFVVIRTRFLTEKEQRERALFLRFVATQPELKGRNWTQQERPDFLVGESPNVVGVEVTEVLVSQELKATETLRSRVMRAAKASFHETTDVPLLVNALLGTRLRLSRLEAEELGRALGRAIASYPDLSGVGRIRYNQLPKGVSSISFARLKDGASPVWGAVESGAVPEITTAAITGALQKKEKLVRAYDEACDETWLLIAVEAFRPSGWFDVVGPALDETYDSSFQRAYVLDYQNSKAVRLRLRPPTCV